MKGNEKKSKELKKAKSEKSSTKVLSDYQIEKTAKSILPTLAPKPKK